MLSSDQSVHAEVLRDERDVVALRYIRRELIVDIEKVKDVFHYLHGLGSEVVVHDDTDLAGLKGVVVGFKLTRGEANLDIGPDRFPVGAFPVPLRGPPGRENPRGA